MVRMSGAQSISHIYCITRSRFTRVLDRSLSPALICAHTHTQTPILLLPLSPLSYPRDSAARITRRARRARRENALRPSFARAWARHRHAPARMDFRYVTGNLRRVYDYSLRDEDAAVTHTHTRDNNDGQQLWWARNIRGRDRKRRRAQKDSSDKNAWYMSEVQSLFRDHWI